MDKLERLQELLQQQNANDIFVGTLEETQKRLKEKGLDFSVEELRVLAEGVLDSQLASKSELSESDLELVTGGKNRYTGVNRDMYEIGYILGKTARDVLGWAKKLGAIFGF